MNTRETVLKCKHELNAVAELGWNEIRSTEFIQTFLNERPIKFGFAGKKTGLVYRLGRGKQSILLRADLDALRTQKGVKHTCGHSSHISGLMGAFLDTLSQVDELNKKNKSVYFLFQPAEETHPSGAKAFIDECREMVPHIRHAFSVHVRPKMPLGAIGLKSGSVWARGDYFEIEIQGKMIHVKDAPLGIDGLEAGSHCILAIKKIQKRFMKRLRINIGVMNGGLQPNTVADYTILKGDVRLRYDKDQRRIEEVLRKEIKLIEQRTKTKIELRYYSGCPTVINNRGLTRRIMQFLKTEKEGFKIVSDSSLFSYACEDFAFIAEKIPSVNALIGTGDRFDIHEENCTISDDGTMNVYRFFSKIIEWWLD